MAIYINKAGMKVDEKVVGTKTAEDWASQGFSAYTEPEKPALPSGSVAIPGGKIDQYNVLGQIGETGTPGSYLYGTPKIISSETLGADVAPVKLPDEVKPQDPSDMIAGATASQKTLQDYINEISAQKTETQKYQGGVLDSIASLTKELEGKGTEQLSMEEKLGLPDMQKDLADINAQITTKLAEYEDANIRIEGGEMARAGSSVVSQRRLSQKQSQLMREKASEVGLLQARALGIQGNITAAQETANRAIDLKYSTIEAQINTYEAQLRAIQPLLDEEQTIRAEARQQMINDQKEAIAEQKEAEKAINAIALKVIQNGGDNALANQIANAKTEVEAMQIAGQLGVDGGWKYVATPAERDNLIRQGYEITQSGGRTYARKETPEMAKLRAQKELEREFEDTGKMDISDIIKGEEAGYVYDAQKGWTKKENDTFTSQSGKTYSASGYAADSVAWSNAIQNRLNSIGKFETIEDVDEYIRNNKADSSISGQMIANASMIYGIGWEELIAVIQHESILGTSNVAKNNNNPGGITWSQTYQDSHSGVTKGTARPSAEGGNYVKFATMQDGVNAVAEQLARRVTTETTDTDAILKTTANNLAKTLYGASAIKTKDGYANFVEPLIERLKSGETADQISDSLRIGSQSIEFTGAIRDAAQQITSKLSTTQTDTVFDKLDDVVDTEDPKKIQDFLKKIAVDYGTGAEEAKQIRGKERTIEFMEEIRNDLAEYEKLGGKTNIFVGNVEKISGKVGEVKDAKLREIATKIATAIQQYRRSMSGVAFSVPESKEYSAIFPNIDKVSQFNTAVINSLTDTFRGDLDYFYGFTMGTDAYNEIFKSNTVKDENGNLRSGVTSTGLKYIIE